MLTRCSPTTPADVGRRHQIFLCGRGTCTLPPQISFRKHLCLSENLHNIAIHDTVHHHTKLSSLLVERIQPNNYHPFFEEAHIIHGASIPTAIKLVYMMQDVFNVRCKTYLKY